MRTIGIVLPVALCSAACASSTAPCPAVPPGAAPAPASAPAPAPAPASAPGPTPDLSLLLRPAASVVHVEVALARAEAAPGPWRIALGSPDRVTHAAARDASGEIPVEVRAAPPGVELRLARAASGTATVSYDVSGAGDAPDDPLGVLVLDNRFRAAGEKLVALPDAVDDARAAALVRIDGDALRASAAATSLGVGTARRTTLTPRALRHATFIAGSLGVQVIDNPAAGHDEGAWLGYTAFDPRPTVAELAQVRSSLRELLKSQADPGSWTYLFVSQTRPIGSFTSTPRSGSILLQVGPAEPWTASIRLSMAQQLARRSIGGTIALAAQPAGEGLWFSEGMSRYVATVLLGRLGSLSPDEVRDAVAGELSVTATSPHRALPNARLAQLAQTDEAARATLMARGALYALHEGATLRARTKGRRGLVEVLAELVRHAEDAKQREVPLDAWIAALTRDDPDAARTFDAIVARGEPIALPAGALGPCFRPGTGEYVAYDPGFDVDATRESPEGRVSGVRPGGPAAAAGLKDGDVVVSMQAREGDSSVPVKLVVDRGGSKVTIAYPPRGAHGRGQTWTRVPMADANCGSLP